MKSFFVIHNLRADLDVAITWTWHFTIREISDDHLGADHLGVDHHGDDDKDAGNGVVTLSLDQARGPRQR